MPQNKLVSSHLSPMAARANKTLQKVPENEWPEDLLTWDKRPKEAWLSRDYLVQIYEHPDESAIRLTVCRTRMHNGRWVDGLDWDELQAIKNAVGFADKWLVEVFPPEDQVVNIQNMRHLFVLDEPPDYGW